MTVELYAQAGPVRPSLECPLLAPVTFYFTFYSDSSAVFAQKESPGAPPAFASPPDPWGRLHRSPLAFPAWVRPPETARTPGSDKERPVERREPSVTKEEKDRYVLYTVAPYLLQCCRLQEFLHSVPLCPPTPPLPGTSLSHGPSCEFLLLHPRPGLVRKELGQPKSLCG